MPYMEETALAEFLVQAELDPALRDQAVIQKAIVTPVETMYCPSRRPAAAYPLHHWSKSVYGDVGARTDYAMNGGSGVISSIETYVNSDGIWVLGKRVAFKHVTDGLTNTYLVGEKAMDPTMYTTGEHVGDMVPIVGIEDHWGAATSYVRYASAGVTVDRQDNCITCHLFGSAHVAGWNATMADGSVRTLSYEMDLSTHRSFASTQGDIGLDILDTTAFEPTTE